MNNRQVEERLLKALAYAKFGKESFNDAENSLLHQASTGELPFCAEEDLEDVSHSQRRIRPELIGWLCMDEQARRCVHWQGIKVCGAVINGFLDLLFVNIDFPLAFRYCWMDLVVDLTDAQITELVLSNCYVLQVKAQGLKVKYDLLLKDGVFTDVGLPGAQIGGVLDCRGTKFTGDLYAERISVSGSIFLSDGFTSQGAEINLVGAQIGGDLDCSGGTFINANHTTINLKDAKVTGSVFLAQDRTSEGKIIPFKSEGTVNFDGAQIDGSLSCTGVFSNPRGDALSAYRAVVKSGISLRDGFTADGRVNLNGVAVEGDFVCSGGDFQSATLNLTDASVATLIDSGLNDTPPGLPVNSPPTIWPRPSRLLVDGFIYGRISSEGPIEVDKRLNWLALQPQSPFYPRPYLQLAKVLRESGDDNGAKRVLIEMEDRARKNGAWAPIIRPLLRWTIGYGYDPLRAFWWAAGLSGLGWIIYRRSYLAGSISPSDKDAYAEFNKSGGKIPEHYPSFSPLIYSLENSLPLVKLGQGDKWQPHRPGMSGPMRIRSSSEFAYRIPWTQLLAKGQSRWQALLRQMTELWGHAPRWVRSCFASLSATTTAPRFVMWFLWFQILLGWLLATLFVAGLSGIVHK
jgi:uncharacterized protein YjbI with pentapeptide repeats